MMCAQRILIVDDEASLRFLVSKQLSRAGFEALSAADGPTALDMAAAQAVDAIVLDVTMPGMDGFEVCRRLKADPRTAAVPVVFLSASLNGDFRRRAFSLGAADFLAKPFQIAELPVYLRAILREAGARETPQAGRMVAVIGADRAADSAAAAVRLAETEALKGDGPVMLIDLELPAGSIGARLQLAGGPNVRFLLHNTGEPAPAAVARVSQRLHAALEVIPAPFSPSLLGQDAPDPRRLSEVLDYLTGVGYYVVLHLGTKVDDLTAEVLRRASLVCAATQEGAGEAARETFLALLTEAGAPRERIAPPDEPARQRDGQIAPAVTRARAYAPNRLPEPAGGQLAAIG